MFLHSRFPGRTLCGFFFASAALARFEQVNADPIVLQPDEQRIVELGRYVTVAEDPNHEWTIANVARPDFADHFKPAPSERPNFGLSRSAFWLRVEIKNDLKNQTEFVIQCEYPLLDHLDLYWQGGDGAWNKIAAGDQAIRSGRADWQRTPHFAVRLQPGQTKVYFLHAWSEGTVIVPVTLLTERVFEEREREVIAFFACCLGIIVVMCLYNLLYAAAARDAASLTYCLFLAGIAFFILTQCGLGDALFWGPANWVTNPALPFGGGVAILGAGIFFPVYLDAKRQAPRLQYLLHSNVIGGLVLMVAAFAVSYRICAMLLIALAGSCGLTVLIVMVRVWRRGYRPAGLALVSWGTAATGFIIVALKFTGLLTSNILTDNAHIVASIFGVTLQSLAIAERMNFLQKERLEAQENVIRSQEKHAAELEEKVRERTRELEKATHIAEGERRASEKLLLSILPVKVARELKETGRVEPIFYESVSVLFTDFVGFTESSQVMRPRELVEELDGCFTRFDEIARQNRMEKLKTIGDSYMCAAGLPAASSTHALDACLAALELRSFMDQRAAVKSSNGQSFWRVRIGIHSGPVTAGVIGTSKFAYDIWGDTVNTASRMESSGEAGKINISADTFALVRDFFQCEHRGKVHAKGKGEMDMYFLLRIRPEFSADTEGLTPNAAFESERSANAAV